MDGGELSKLPEAGSDVEQEEVRKVVLLFWGPDKVRSWGPEWCGLEGRNFFASKEDAALAIRPTKG